MMNVENAPFNIDNKVSNFIRTRIAEISSREL